MKNIAFTAFMLLLAGLMFFLFANPPAVPGDKVDTNSGYASGIG